MRTATLILLASAISAAASDSQVTASLGEERLGVWHMATLPYRNPAINQWRMSTGLTRVDGAYTSRTDHGDVDTRLGSGEHAWSAGADTYTKYRSSTLWGAARYLNGSVEDAVWCETADPGIVYPYLLADSVGGDMKQEKYAFSGGYADNKGRWAWGAELSYEATLAYRDVDPRPKNVVGKLDAAVGIAYAIGQSYHAGISLNFRKYKQTNDIDFKSEMGVDKIFHLTGMATHYNRFGGDALSTYYDGYRYGVSADFYPSAGQGVFASCALSRFSFDNILTGLNKLPMASAWHKSIEVECGWLQPGAHTYAGGSAHFSAYRRHGSENIFGDASAGIYPQIGSNAMYADNGTSAGAKGMWGLYFGNGSRFSAMADATWHRRVTTYVEPWRHSRVNDITVSIGAGTDFVLPHRWLFSAGADAVFYRPFDCAMTFTEAGSDSEMRQLEAIELHCHDLAVNAQTGGGVALGIARTIADRYMLRLSADWHRRTYTQSIHSDSWQVRLAVIF